MTLTIAKDPENVTFFEITNQDAEMIASFFFGVAIAEYQKRKWYDAQRYAKAFKNVLTVSGHNKEVIKEKAKTIIQELSIPDHVCTDLVDMMG